MLAQTVPTVHSYGEHARMMEIVKPASSTRAAGSQFAKKHMLAQSLPATHALSLRFSL